jgi:hypothetical protein
MGGTQSRSIDKVNSYYVVEYAKSDRSCCKVCKTAIKKDSLRCVRYIQSGRFKATHNLHARCAWNQISTALKCDTGLPRLTIADGLKPKDVAHAKSAFAAAIQKLQTRCK